MSYMYKVESIIIKFISGNYAMVIIQEMNIDLLFRIILLTFKQLKTKLYEDS